MAHEKDIYDMDKIPDYAMQPAREDIDTFDPTVYEKLFSELAPLEREEAEIVQQQSGDDLTALFERLIAEEAAAQAEAKIEAAENAVKSEAASDKEEAKPEAAATDKEAKPEAAATDKEAKPEAAATDKEAKSEAAATDKETKPEASGTDIEVKAEAVAAEGEALAEAAAMGRTVESGSVRGAQVEEIAETVAAVSAKGAANESAVPVEVDVDEVAAPAEEKAAEVAAPAEEDVEEVIAPVAPGGGTEPSAPVSAPTPSMPAPAPAKIIPAGSSVMSTNLKLTDIRTKPKIRLFIEEDILVPDVKPDLATVLSMEASVKLSEQEISVGAQGTDSLKLTGDLMVSTLYLPDRSGGKGQIVAIESRIPFKEETDIKAEPYSELAASATVESIDFTVTNERKFKVKATVAIDLKEYRALNLELFEGLRDEEVQMLSETIHLTDVALRKTESLEISEELPLKDGSGPAGKILCYDVNVVENHKQITGEKAVVNGTAYVNAMYIVEEAGEFDPEEGAEQVTAEPVLFQGKAEFTQFIKLDDDGPAERAAQNPVGSKVNFRIAKVELTPSQSEENGAGGFTLDLDIETTLELYKDLETDVVTDVYHHMKEMRYDTREVSVMNLCGSGVAEVSAREIVNVPEKYGAVDRVVYITGRISDVRAGLDAGKSVTEGVVSLSMICIAAGDEKTPFSLKKEIPFRSAIDIPGIRGDMEVDSEALLKELWYDKINNRQIEVNAGVLVNTTVCSREKHPLINNVSFVETADNAGNEPSIILYITRDGDNVWRIAKKYRTTIDNIKKINGIDDSGRLKAGTKLLIVK